MQKLDKKDKKILAALELDGRAPLGVVAAKAGLSKAGAAKRIAKLRQEGIIDCFIIHVSYRALSLYTFRLYLKFDGAPAGLEKEIGEWLMKSGHMRWFAPCQGEYDMVVRAMVSDTYEFQQFQSEFFAKFGKYIGKRAFSAIGYDAYHNITHLTGNEGFNSEPEKEYRGKPVRLSEEDFRVLYELVQDCRRSAREIAEKAGMTPDSVLYHMRKLEREGVVTRYTVKLDRTNLGYNTIKTLIWLRQATAQDVLKLRRYWEAHPRVSFYGEMIGPWNLEVDLDVSSAADAHAILQEARAKFAGLIYDVSVLTLIREYEVNFLTGKVGWIGKRVQG